MLIPAPAATAWCASPAGRSGFLRATPCRYAFPGLRVGLEELIALHHPDRVALEDVFYAVNVKSALKLGQVRGVAMLTAATAGLDVAEYSPLSIKSAVVGYGRAEKHQVQQMVARLLQLEEIPEPPDAADALAIAICHLHTAATLELQNAGLARRAAR